MFTLNILKANFRRVCALKANGCVGGCRNRSSRVAAGGVCKMLQKFEDYVFQQTDNNCSNLIDNLNNKQYQNNKLTFSEHNQEYENAIKALNGLQTNAESLRSSSHLRKRLNSLQDTQRYLIKSGVSIKDLEKLSYIHVSGTKGKGSTCALTDSILRSYGVKTGFYSSPHLISVTERFRINGQPITKQKFTEYFWRVYNKLNTTQEYENDMPAYFKFLTVLAFHVYLAEKVDVVILEVGIGGELDCTNVVPNTKTVGITSLGLEHTQLLGNTLEEIAWQKAGIIKPNSTVYTTVTQEQCWQIIKERAAEKQAALYRVPKFETYFQVPKMENLKKQKINNCAVLNGSLAVQLAYDWLRRNCNGFHRDYEINKPHLTEQAIAGILNCNWPGRCQRIKFFNFIIHLDGAHTEESMQVCSQWFNQVTSDSVLPNILIFNATGDRDTKKLLTVLQNFLKFEMVCFVPNISSLTSYKENQDNKSVLHDQVEQMKRVQIHSAYWLELCNESKQQNNAKMFTSIVQCFQHIRQMYNKSQHLNILVTGSIHLIGATILSLNEMCPDLYEEYG